MKHIAINVLRVTIESDVFFFRFIHQTVEYEGKSRLDFLPQQTLQCFDEFKRSIEVLNLNVPLIDVERSLMTILAVKIPLMIRKIRNIVVPEILKTVTLWKAKHSAVTVDSELLNSYPVLRTLVFEIEGHAVVSLHQMKYFAGFEFTRTLNDNMHLPTFLNVIQQLYQKPVCSLTLYQYASTMKALVMLDPKEKYYRQFLEPQHQHNANHVIVMKVCNTVSNCMYLPVPCLTVEEIKQ
jgi:hypothetical protein